MEFHFNLVQECHPPVTHILPACFVISPFCWWWRGKWVYPGNWFEYMRVRNIKGIFANTFLSGVTICCTPIFLIDDLSSVNSCGQPGRNSWADKHSNVSEFLACSTDVRNCWIISAATSTVVVVLVRLRNTRPRTSKAVSDLPVYKAERRWWLRRRRGW